MSNRHDSNSKTDSETRPETIAETDSETDVRYATLETGDGDLIIYDREEPSAWVQSNHTVDLET